MEIHSNLIPGWIVAVAMLYTGIMWFVNRKRKIFIDTRIFTIVLILEGIVYGVAFQYFNIDVEIRGFYSRLMMLVLCFSQAFPLTVEYFRSRR